MYYVVTQGDYSDYHIVGVTADKEVAKKIAKKFSNGWGECEIEEYEDGECLLGLTPYEVHFNEVSNCVSLYNIERERYEAHEGNCVEEHYAEGYWHTYAVYVLARDGEAALKIAKEKLTIYKAREKGLV